MSFSKYVCWQPGRIEHVMETEALQSSDAIFLATHHPLVMMRSTVGSHDHSHYTEEQFLRDFLTPSDYVFVPVLGEAGTGKSHLIRWLSLKIPPAKNRHVILIPKVGTNLRGVIRLILGRFTGPEFDDYRRQLKESTDSLNIEQAAQKLLDNLAFEAGLNRTGGTQTLNEEERFLAASLPDLLYDPFFRAKFLAKDGLLSRLSQHVLGKVEAVERLEEHRRFGSQDLPLNLRDWAQAGQRARQVYSDLLGSEDLQQQAVEWLNHNLDAAIASLLELRGDKLSHLMLEIRRQLAGQGAELVLLIEDFARLQGIENQLLEALLVRPHQGEIGELCALRTAIACTAGYFRPLAETVQQRTSFVISLDQLSEPTDRRDGVPVDLASFAARYLNAIRVPHEDLEHWYQNARGVGPPESVPVPNGCERCEFQKKCHHGFGESLAMGLYPFTEMSLQRMNERLNSGPFNPRKLVKDVLRHTLENYGDEIRRAQFPSSALNQYFGRQLELRFQQILQVGNNRNAGRYEALLDLWTDGQAVKNLDPTIHEAFDLPELRVTKTDSTTSPPSEPTRVAAKPASIPLPGDVQIIQQWANGNRKLPQDVVTKLRDRLHKAIDNHIDWDSERLSRDYFTRKWFVTGSINFQEQATQVTQSAFRLMIPEKASQETMRTVGLALEGMLRFEHEGNWEFQGGSQYLRHYVSLLDNCAQQVLARIRRPLQTEPDWDPIPLTVQVLALTARLNGLSLDAQRSTNGMFALHRAPDNRRNKKWRELLESLCKYRDDLRDLLLAYAACTKGSTDLKNVQYIDASRLLSPLVDLDRAGWSLTADIPAALDGRFDALKRAANKLLGLEEILELERVEWSKWLRRVTEEFGSSFDRQKAVQEVRTSRDQIAKVGMLPQSYNQVEFDKALVDVQNADVVHTFEKVRTAVQSKNRAELLERLGVDLETPMDALDRFGEVVLATLNGAVKRMETELTNITGGDSASLGQMHSAILQALDSIRSDVKKLSGGAKC
jgi:hypothetical protein